MLKHLLFSLLLCLLFPLSNAAQASQDTFVRGEEIIFVDSLIGEMPGEFPRKWDLFRGTAENGLFEGKPVITSTATTTTIFPLMDREDYLPEEGWTLEFDVYFPHRVGHYQLNWNKRRAARPLRIRADQMTFNKQRHWMTGGTQLGWRHVAISYIKGSMKVWLDGVRVANAPKVGVELKNLEFQLYAPKANLDAGLQPVLTNVRLAKAKLSLYERLVTSGKLVFSNITFDTGKASLTQSSYAVIEEIANLLQDKPDLNVSIEGHTDNVGDTASNQSLSEARAAAVKAALLKHGVSEDRLGVKGHGEQKPIASNTTDEGRAINRRVEIIRVN